MPELFVKLDEGHLNRIISETFAEQILPLKQQRDHWETSYRLLADAVIDWFNPEEKVGDGEEWICHEAIRRAVAFVESFACDCGYSVACDRCRVLGRFQDVAVER